MSQKLWCASARVLPAAHRQLRGSVALRQRAHLGGWHFPVSVITGLDRVKQPATSFSPILCSFLHSFTSIRKVKYESEIIYSLDVKVSPWPHLFSDCPFSEFFRTPGYRSTGCSSLPCALHWLHPLPVSFCLYVCKTLPIRTACIPPFSQEDISGHNGLLAICPPKTGSPACTRPLDKNRFCVLHRASELTFLWREAA